MVCLGLSLISGKTASTKKARWPSRINNPLWWRLNGILGNVLLYRHWTTYWLLLHCIASHCRSRTIIVLECQMISFVLLSLFQPRFIDVCLYVCIGSIPCLFQQVWYIHSIQRHSSGYGYGYVCGYLCWYGMCIQTPRKEQEKMRMISYYSVFSIILTSQTRLMVCVFSYKAWKAYIKHRT